MSKNKDKIIKNISLSIVRQLELLDQKFNSLDRKIDNLNQKVDAVEQKIKELEIIVWGLGGLILVACLGALLRTLNI